MTFARNHGLAAATLVKRAATLTKQAVTRAADDEEAPDQRRVTPRQAQYLASLARVDEKALAGRRIAELHETLRWRIDPQLLLFRRICGRVVKADPQTGALHGVPNATVYVEDTDCSFLGFFPTESPWGWLFPGTCRREVIATVKTDACGHFCVNIPLWDIDRILRFRRERVCIDLVKPSIRDILDRIHPEVSQFPPIGPVPPGPGPDPWERVRLTAQFLGSGLATTVEAQRDGQEFAGSKGRLEALLDAPALEWQALPPPLHGAQRQIGERTLKMSMGQTETLKEIDLERYIGPFFRCFDVFVPMWTTILDVPDITFRVTQDVDGDGDEETIYAESFFDVRWNAGPIPDVTLVAWGNALSTAICEPPPVVCVDEPEISVAGYMELEPAYHDNATGYGVRVNRPRPPDGLFATPQSGSATAPYTGAIDLHGCHHIGAATHYRLLYSYEGGTAVPFTGVDWWAPRLGPGGPIHFTADADGWYAIGNPAQLVFPHWLFEWPTTHYPNGRYDVTLEVGQSGGGGISSLGTSEMVRFAVDNAAPHASFVEIRWRPASVVDPSWTNANSTLLPAVCPVIERPAGVDIRIRIVWSASADHFRDAHLGFSGCGAGGAALVSGIDTTQHWYTAAGDNALLETAIFDLPGNRPGGCYSASIAAYTRAFNPGSYNYGPIFDWYINQAWRAVYPSRAISLVNT